MKHADNLFDKHRVCPANIQLFGPAFLTKNIETRFQCISVHCLISAKSFFDQKSCGFCRPCTARDTGGLGQPHRHAIRPSFEGMAIGSLEGSLLASTQQLGILEIGFRVDQSLRPETREPYGQLGSRFAT